MEYCILPKSFQYRAASPHHAAPPLDTNINELSPPCLVVSSTASTIVKLRHIVVAVVTHIGNGFTSGHYTTLARKTREHMSKWVLFDVEKVRHIAHAEVVNKDAYTIISRLTVISKTRDGLRKKLGAEREWEWA